MNTTHSANQSGDVLSWCEPVISELIYHEYESYFGEKLELTKIVAPVHAQLWKCLLQNDVRKARHIKQTLANIAVASKVNQGFLDKTDLIVLEVITNAIAHRNDLSAIKSNIEEKIVMHAAENLKNLM